MLAHREEEDKVSLLTLTEIAEAQRKDQELKVHHKKNAKMPQKVICFQLVENTKVMILA